MIESLLDGCEQLTREYQKLTDSRGYRLKQKLMNCKSLLKDGKILKFFKCLFLDTSKLDRFIVEDIPWQHTSHLSDKRIAVYTAVFGAYDSLLEPLVKPDNIDYYIITDQPVADSSLWKKIETVDFPPDVKTNVEKNRFVKMRPDLIFKDYDYSIYVDGNVLITSDLSPMAEQLGELPIAMHRHKNRDCVYDEIKACIRKDKGSARDFLQHKKLLKSHGIPYHWGLLEAPVIARRHHEPLCIDLMQQWWEEFTAYSKRDQISIIDVLWRNGLTVDQFATLGNNVYKSNYFLIMMHK